MKRNLSIILVFLMLATSGAAQAQTQPSAACHFLVLINEMHFELGKGVRRPAEIDRFERRLHHVDDELGNGNSIDGFTRDEFAEFKYLLTQIKRHWARARSQAHEGRTFQMPGQLSARIDKLMRMRAPLDCDMNSESSWETEKNKAVHEKHNSFDIDKISGVWPQLSAAQIWGLLGLMVALSFGAFKYRHVIFAFDRRSGERRLCNTPVLLDFGENCSITRILDVSRHGAKLRAPAIDVTKKDLVLFTFGQEIPARQQWSNKFFIGVSFKHPISRELCDEITSCSSARDEAEVIGKNSQNCFYKGCQLDCPKHRPMR